MKMLLLPIGLGLLLACASETPDPLPFDLEPVMGAVREDTARIARHIAGGSLADAVSSARRIADLRLAPGRQAPPGFRYLEGRLKEAAGGVAKALAGNDRALVQERFDLLLGTCADCHAQYRPGGVPGR